MKVSPVFCLLLLVAVGACQSMPGEESMSGTAGAAPLEFPVEVAASQFLGIGEDASVVTLDSEDSAILFQRAPGLMTKLGTDAGVFCALLKDDLAFDSGQIRSTTSNPRFEFREESAGRLLLLEAEKPVLAYNFGVQSAAGIPTDRQRSTYVHPVYDLDGNLLTDDFPEDHYHHRGLSWMWPRVWVGETPYDLWHIRGLRQQFGEWLAREVGPVCATLGVRNTWEAEGRTVAQEWVWLRVFRSNAEGRVIDLALTWEAADEKIRLRGADERAYGGLCFRLAPRKDARIFSPQGWMRSDSDLVPLAWADQSGRFGSTARVSGVTVMQHPENPDYPAGWCLRYYGFLGVSWPGERVVTIEPQQRLTLRFRIWVHRGDVESGGVEEVFSAFADPPRIEVR